MSNYLSGCDHIRKQRQTAFSKGRLPEQDLKVYITGELSNFAVFCITLNSSYVPKDIDNDYIDKIKSMPFLDRIAFAGQFCAAEIDRLNLIDAMKKGHSDFNAIEWLYRRDEVKENISESLYADRFDQLLELGFSFDSTRGFVYDIGNSNVLVATEAQIRGIRPGEWEEYYTTTRRQVNEMEDHVMDAFNYTETAQNSTIDKKMTNVSNWTETAANQIKQLKEQFERVSKEVAVRDLIDVTAHFVKELKILNDRYRSASTKEREQ